MRIIIFLMMAFLIGCGELPGPPSHRAVEENTECSDTVSRIYCGEFQLSDGTRCVSFNGYHGMGVSCDWKTTPVNPKD